MTITRGSVPARTLRARTEGAVIEAAQRVIAGGGIQRLRFGVTNEMAWEVGLACGGDIEIFVERIE